MMDVPVFEVSQSFYFRVKEFWARAKIVPLLHHLLNAAEGVATQILRPVNADLISFEQQVVLPPLKSMDKFVFSPLISKGCKIFDALLKKSKELFGWSSDDASGDSLRNSESNLETLSGSCEELGSGNCSSILSEILSCDTLNSSDLSEKTESSHEELLLADEPLSVTDHSEDGAILEFGSLNQLTSPSRNSGGQIGKPSPKRRRSMFSLFVRKKYFPRRHRKRSVQRSRCNAKAKGRPTKNSHTVCSNDSPCHSEDGETPLIKEAISFISSDECINLREAYDGNGKDEVGTEVVTV